MFRLSPCPPDFVETAPARFELEADLAGTPEQVFEVVSSIAHEARWFPDFKQAHWVTPGPPGAGATRDYRLSYLRLIEHFTVWKPGEHLVFWVSACSLPLLSRFLEDYQFRPTPDGGTHLCWRVVYQPLAILRPLHPVIRPFFAKDFEKAMANLVSHCQRLFGDVDPLTGRSRSGS
jgi:hypothetical protein